MRAWARPANARSGLLGLLDGSDWTVEVASRLTEDSPADVEDILERLADAQLIETRTPGRYRFHTLLRLFALDLVEEDEPEQVRRAALERALTYYLEKVRQAVDALRPTRLRRFGAGTPFSSYQEGLSWLDTERQNLVAAVRQASEHHWDSLTWQLAETPWEFNLRRYWPGHWQEMLELGVESAQRAGDRRAEGQMLHHLGYVLRDRRQYDEATTLLTRSLQITREIQDRSFEAVVLGTLGTTYRRQREFDKAIEYYDQSLPIRLHPRQCVSRAGELRRCGGPARAVPGHHARGRSTSPGGTHTRQPGAVLCRAQPLRGGGNGASAEPRGLQPAGRSLRRWTGPEELRVGRLRNWLQHPEQPKTWWSEWEL